MKTVPATTTFTEFLAFVQSHDLAIALAVIFAFAGAIAFSPQVTK